MKPTLIDWEAVARAHLHPQRVSVLELLAMDGGRALSPNEMALELQTSRSNLSYHVAELRKFGLVEIVEEQQRRGAIEQYHALTAPRGSK